MARIAVIDDEESVRRLLKLVLELAEHEVLVANDGVQGLDVVRSQHPDLIVLDVMMPSMDGLTMLKQLHAEEKAQGIPVLVLTAATLSAVTVELLQSGADQVMTKPFDPAKVVVAVNDLLAAYERRVSTSGGEVNLPFFPSERS